MKYKIFRTDKADEQLNAIIMRIANDFDADIALNILNEVEQEVVKLEEFPMLGVIPKYRTLRLQGYRVLIVKKTLVFYKVFLEDRKITIFAFFDSRQEYLNLL